MKEEGQATPSQYVLESGDNKNLCILGEDAEQSGDESWSIVIFERNEVREMWV